MRSIGSIQQFQKAGKDARSTGILKNPVSVVDDNLLQVATLIGRILFPLCMHAISSKAPSEGFESIKLSCRCRSEILIYADTTRGEKHTQSADAFRFWKYIYGGTSTIRGWLKDQWLDGEKKLKCHGKEGNQDLECLPVHNGYRAWLLLLFKTFLSHFYLSRLKTANNAATRFQGHKLE